MLQELIPDFVPETPQRLELRREVRAFIADELSKGLEAPVANGWLSSWDSEFSKRLAQRGWLGMTIPKEYGGRGGSFLDRFVVTEELLAAGMPVAAHWIADRQIAPSLLKFGNEVLKQRLLPQIAAGTVFFAIGMSEPDAGSDLAAVRTKGERVEGGWKITGNKVWTSGAHQSDYFIALARTAALDTSDRHAGLTQFIVDLKAPGVDIKPIASIDGSHHFNEVFLDGVFVADEYVLGEVGSGWRQVTSELSFERSGPERLLSTFCVLEGLVDVTRRGDLELTAELGAIIARLSGLHLASVAVADALSNGRETDAVATIVKTLGTVTEGDIVELASHLVPSGSKSPRLRRLRALTDAALLERPGFTLRGGTNEILRGVLARRLGLR